MFHWRVGTLAVVLTVLAACQSPPHPPQSAEPKDAEVRAARALAAGRYADAAGLYQQALADAPSNLRLHYGLGVASSYLDRRDDAIREFRWVVSYGAPEAPEVDGARRWLTRAGALPIAASAPASPPQPQRRREAGNASLEGHAVFAEAGQEPTPMRRQQLFLVGQPDSPTQKERYSLRTGEDGTFKFPNVVPGPYKLVNQIAGQPIWRMRVDLKPSETKILDLTPENSLASRDDFPE